MFKFLAILFVLFSNFCCADNYKYKLSICAIFQDEAPYLKEWIEFHRIVGVEHFYLYNHRSTDNYKKVLQPYINAGIVDLIDIPKVAKKIIVFNRLQCKCYNECLALARGKSKWIAFIDIDEYLFPVVENSLKDLLKDYDKYGGLYANWRMFGTSGVKKIPKDHLLIEALTNCTTKSFPANQYIKSIVKPEHVAHFPNPHHPVYLNGFYQVNTDKIPFKGPFICTNLQTNKVRINHYWTRDEDYFYNAKIIRQKKWGAKVEAENILQCVNKEKDDAILRFAPALRKAIFPESDFLR